MPGLSRIPKRHERPNFLALLAIVSISGVAFSGFSGCKQRQVVSTDESPGPVSNQELAANPHPGVPIIKPSSDVAPSPTSVDESTLKELAAGPWAPKVEGFLPMLSKPQGNRFNTMTVAALKARPRHSYFLMSYQDLIDENQVKLITDIVDNFEWAYEDLITRRHWVLEHYRDGDLVKKLLAYNIAAIIAVNSEIRTIIYRDVLTPEQKNELNARHMHKNEKAGEGKTEKTDRPLP